MNIEEAKQILERSSKLHLQVDREPNKFDIAIETILAELDKKDRIIKYAIERIIPSPEEYLEIKNIMKQNKWGYNHSKIEYFEKKVGEE